MTDNNNFDLHRAIAEAQQPLEVRIAALRTANNYLTRRNKVRARVRIVLQAEGSALAMTVWHLAGWRTGRDSCMTYGMTDRQWHYGRALLQVARVMGRSYEGWLIDNPEQIEAAIKGAAERCALNPEILIARLPLSRQLTPASKLKRRVGQ